MRRPNTQQTSPLKATQWAKKGLTVPVDSDGAYRVHRRLDGRNLLTEKKEAKA